MSLYFFPHKRFPELSDEVNSCIVLTSLTFCKVLFFIRASAPAFASHISFLFPFFKKIYILSVLTYSFFFGTTSFVSKSFGVNLFLMFIMYALLKVFFLLLLFLHKGQVCIYFVGLLMQVQNGKMRLKILKRLSSRIFFFLLLLLDFVCGCSRSHTRGSLHVMNNQPAGLGAACSSRVSQRLTDAALEKIKIKISKAT